MKKHIESIRSSAGKDTALPDAAFRILSVMLNRKTEATLEDPFFATHADVSEWLGGKSRRSVQANVSALVRRGYLVKLEMVGCPPRRLYRINVNPTI